MGQRKFGVFVISYRRALRMHTPLLLKHRGCTYPIYILISDDDPEACFYRECGYPVEVYRREDYREMCDIGDARRELSMCSQVRNAAFDVARKLGLTHFAVFDDDYIYMSWRIIRNNQLSSIQVKKFDAVADCINDTLDRVPRLSCISLAQGGDFVGGASSHGKSVHRKMMNSMFFRTDRRIRFVGRFNDDITTYTLGQATGRLLCITIPFCTIGQLATMSAPGGMTEAYATNGGGYTKAMYSVIRMPSSIRVAPMQSKYPRVHTKVLSDFTYPKVVEVSHEDV